MNNLLSSKSIAFMLCLLLGASASHASSQNKELTPNDKLIYAVKGYKTGLALLAGMVNPILGGLVALYEPQESDKDLRNIDAALANGAYINYKEEHSGYTALIYAAYKGYPNIAAYLISKGANVQIKEDKGYNAYTMAKYYLNDYTKSLERNEEREITPTFTQKDRNSMREFLRNHIANYQKIVDMLEPITSDLTMPFSWW